MRKTWLVLCCIVSLLFCQRVTAQYETDIRAVTVSFPPDDSVMREKSAFQVRGRFLNQGIQDRFDVRARVQIKRCTDKFLGFQADSLIPELFHDSTVEFRFPTRQGPMDIRNLEPGCYEVLVIALLSDDVDRTNDTARSTLNISPLDNNIKVDGISAPAADSRFLIGSSVATIVRFRNAGTNTQQNVQLVLEVRDPDSALVLSDAVTEHNWAKNEVRSIAFKNFLHSKIGFYSLRTRCQLIGDEFQADDTLSSRILSDSKSNVGIISILDPGANEKRQLNSTLEPKVFFKHDVNYNKAMLSVPVRLTVYPCSSTSDLITIDTTIPVLHSDSGATLFRFASKGRYNSLSDLPIGCYYLKVILRANDEIASDDTLIQYFKVLDTLVRNNVRLKKVISPVHYTQKYPDSTPVPMVFQYINTGYNDLAQVPFALYIVYQNDSIIYRDTTHVETFSCMEIRDVTFKSFNVEKDGDLGYYTVFAFPLLPTDEDRSDDTLYSGFSINFFCDARAVKVISPADSISQSTAFSPTGLIDWVGVGYFDSKKVSAHMEITTCSDNALVYVADTIRAEFLPLGGTEVKFPPIVSEYNTALLAPGCYNICLSVSFWCEENLLNNEVCSTFTIVPASNVKVNNLTGRGVVQYQNYPNPSLTSTTINFSLAKKGDVALSLIDMTGRQYSLLAEKLFEQGEHSQTFDLRHLPAGIYLYELTFTGTDGSVQRLAKTMSIVK